MDLAKDDAEKKAKRVSPDPAPQAQLAGTSCSVRWLEGGSPSAGTCGRSFAGTRLFSGGCAKASEPANWLQGCLRDRRTGMFQQPIT